MSALDKWRWSPIALVMALAGCGDASGSGGADGCSGPGLCDGVSMADGSETLFDEAVIHDFELTIPPASWDAINAQAEPPGCEQFKRDYHEASLTFEGQTYSGVGLHIKGGCGSSRDLNQKASFKVNLSWDDPAVAGCGPERKLMGQKKLTFNGSVQDQSHTHEVLAYRLFRAAGIPAPRVVHMHLSVNGEYWGVYNLVESIERAFLKRWFPNSKGMMYEAAYWCDILPENVPFSVNQHSCMDLEFTHDACDGPLDPTRDAKDWTLLSALANGLNGPHVDTVLQHLGKFFDLDHLFSYWAVEKIIGHWDGYFGRLVNNYRIYHHPQDGRFYFIPWGTDQTFNESIDVFEVHNTVADQCLEDQECALALSAKVESTLALFETLGLTDELSQLQLKLAQPLSVAPRGRVSENELDRAIANTRNFIDERPAQIRRDLAQGP